MNNLGERGALFVVSDGMCGTVADDVAGAMAVTMLRNGLPKGDSQQATSEQLGQVIEHTKGLEIFANFIFPRRKTNV